MNQVRSIGVGCVVSALLCGCTTTSIDTHLFAGQEYVLLIDTAGSPMRVISRGPASIWVRVEEPDEPPTQLDPIEVGTLEIPIRPPLVLIITNPADDGPESANIRIEMPDPATFTLTQRPATQATAVTGP